MHLNDLPTLTNEHVTDQPWRGPCAITGLTMDEYRECLPVLDQHGNPWEPWVTRAAVSICRSYNIKGSADPGYIANVINNQRLGVTT